MPVLIFGPPAAAPASVGGLCTAARGRRWALAYVEPRLTSTGAWRLMPDELGLVLRRRRHWALVLSGHRVGWVPVNWLQEPS